MAMINKVRDMLDQVLGLGERAAILEADTPLLGNLPELDSMAVVELISDMEARFGITVDDDDISAETFATLASLVAFIEARA
ncbi:MAG: acyl carrier protein [Alphaproteobacteria bacterium]